METKMKNSRFVGCIGSFLLTLIIFTCVGKIFVKELLAQESEEESGQISLQKTVETREYNGKTVEGQERVVSPGDSLWRIFIQEKGLSDKRFGQYLNLVRRLNPQMKTADVLRVGEKIFIPLRPDEMLGYQPALATKTKLAETGKGETKNYTVKQGDYLLRVLREQLGIGDEKRLTLYYNLTKDLNPQKKNWEILQAGETIRLPVVGETREPRNLAVRAPTQPNPGSTGAGENAPTTAAENETAAETKAAISPSINLDYTRQLARENFSLLAQVVESVGNEIQSSGQESLAIRDGAVRVDRNSFPIVYNRKVGQKVLLDPEAKIPDSLRAQLNEKTNSTPVMTMSKTSSVQEAVTQLLARLGFQSLPTQQAVVIQEGGVAFEAKGQWVVLAPQESNKPQEVYVINVTDKAGAVPEYLKSHLALKGLHLREILWPPSSSQNIVIDQAAPRDWISQAKTLPPDKTDIVDALLLSYGIPFSVRAALSWDLGEGLKVETACDRVFEWRGQQTAVFFQRVGPEMKKSLQEQAIKIVELDLASMSSRELVGKLLNELGEQSAYREQRFSAAGGIMRDRLTVITSGFLLPKKSILMTDRDIPEEFQRFFFEKGWEIVYFQ
jgi:hypothetical protein